MHSLLCALGGIVLLAMSPSASAHRVNIFAYVEGNQVVVECSFSKTRPVRAGQIAVYAGASDQILLTGTTDDAGVFRFPVPDQAKTTGLRLALQAGEGHANQWTMDPGEFASAPSPTPQAPPQTAEQPSPPDPTPVPAPSSGITAREVEAIVSTLLDAKLDAKLAPLRRALLEDQGPRLQDILGGIGWIMGIIGVAAYFRRRV
jgi:nickel transport protein